MAVDDKMTQGSADLHVPEYSNFITRKVNYMNKQT